MHSASSAGRLTFKGGRPSHIPRKHLLALGSFSYCKCRKKKLEPVFSLPAPPDQLTATSEWKTGVVQSDTWFLTSLLFNVQVGSCPLLFCN